MKIFLVTLDELILKFIWKIQRTKNTKALLEQKVGELALLDFKTNYKAPVIRQCNEDMRLDNTQIEQHNKGKERSMPTQRANVEQQRFSRTGEKKLSSQQLALGKLDIHSGKKKKKPSFILNSHHTRTLKTTAKWIINIQAKGKTISPQKRALQTFFMPLW